MNISISSLNCRGLNSANKRNNIFERFKNNEITFLQETYITEQKVNHWKNDWNGLFFYSSGTNNSQGLITLIKHDLLNGSEDIFYKSERILGIKGTIEGEEFFFINVYGPNSYLERQNFMNELYNVSRKCTTNNIMIGGDFNIVMNNDLDIIAGAEHDQTAIHHFRNWVYRNDLIDCWRELHGEEKDYTWSRNNPFCARRLDYIFINESLLLYLRKASHRITTGTDHKSVNIKISSEHLERGQGYWKFNNNLLHEPEYVNFMNGKIDNLLDQKFESPKERLESLKSMVKAETILYSKSRKIENDIKQKGLEMQLRKYNKLIITDPENQAYDKRLMEIKKELEIFELNRARGARVRAKMKEVESGEKTINIFLQWKRTMGQ